MTAAPTGEFFGRTTLDLIYKVGRFPEQDEKITAEQFLMHTGGPAANAAITFSLLGGVARLSSALGTGKSAQLAQEELRRFDVPVRDMILERDTPFPVSAILVNSENGSRTIINSMGSQDISKIQAAPREARASPDIALIDGFLAEHFFDELGSFNESEVPVVLDGGSWKPFTRKLLRYVNVAICSGRFRWQGIRPLDDTVTALHDCGIQYVAVTRGAKPILVSEDGRRSEVAVPRVTAVDTLAAGDVFHGAFCYRYALNRQFTEALSFAGEIAAESCKHFGPREWARTEDRQ